jgi:hypothetical protein
MCVVLGDVESVEVKVQMEVGARELSVQLAARRQDVPGYVSLDPSTCQTPRQPHATPANMMESPLNSSLTCKLFQARIFQSFPNSSAAKDRTSLCTVISP